ncbi:MAG: pilin [Proteobacteria bacterium]|nr:pilin [Pseudomonadota bacterium]
MFSKFNRSVQKGFTLIELMIVVAIIGILAAIAIPAYQDYLIRSQVSEGLTMASAAKASVSEYYANHGSWPADNDSAGMGSATDIQGKYVSSITVGGGGITVAYGNEVNSTVAGDQVGLTPGASVNGDVIWRCGDPAADPSGWDTAGTAATDGTTTIANKYLPSSCR